MEVASVGDAAWLHVDETQFVTRYKSLKVSK
jgi:hypothetical protein